MRDSRAAAAGPVLRIALVCPHAWPPRDDVAWRVAGEARALAARGHRVTVLAPATRRVAIAAGRALLAGAAGGDRDALVAAPGAVLEVAIGRALPAGAGRRVREPFDLAATLETVLSETPFDVVHLHEPLAPSPALAALRHAPGVTAATFHHAEPLAAVAFLRPLVDRALARADIRIAVTESDRAALAEILPGGYTVVRPGVDAALFAPPPPATGPPGLVLVARGRDRVGARFALGVLRGLDLDAVGPIALLGPADAPWRTRAAVPKALRGRVAVVPDPGPEGRAAVLGAGRIALVSTAADAAGPVLAEAMASGCAVLAPRGRAVEEGGSHGADLVALPAFSREAWTEALAGLVADPARRAALGAGGRVRAASRGWDAVAAELEGLYRAALEGERVVAAPEERIAADLHVRPGPALTPERIVAACLARGLGAVAVTGADGPDEGRETAALAPPALAVIPGQEVATTDGTLVGLFLTAAVPHGTTPQEAAAAIHAQGGLVMAPREGAPSPQALRALAGRVDVHETDDPGAGATIRRLGLLACAGSGAARPEDVGRRVTELRRFDGPAGLLDALDGARIARPGRARRRRSRPRES